MDITKVPRELIYRDRTDLDEFGVDDEGTLNHAFYDAFINEERLSYYAKEDFLLETFNDAYYIVTLLRLDERPALHMESYKAIAAKGPYNNRPENWMNHLAATFALVYDILISLNYDENKGQILVLKRIRTPFKDEQSDFDSGYLTFDPYHFSHLFLPEEELKNFTVPVDDVSPRNIDFDSIDIAYVLVSDESMKYTFEAIAKISDPEEKYHAVYSLLKKPKASAAKLEFNSLDEKEDFFKRNEDCIKKLQVLKNELEQGRSKGGILDEQQRDEKTEEDGDGKSSLTTKQIAILGLKMSDFLGIKVKSKKKLALVLSKLFGSGIYSLKNKLSENISEEDELVLANIFAEVSPELAKRICKNWQDTPTTLNEPPLQ